MNNITDINNITLDDLKILVAVIDSASQKGCFRAGDLELIGTLSSKLIDIVNANTESKESKENTE